MWAPMQALKNFCLCVQILSYTVKNGSIYTHDMTQSRFKLASFDACANSVYWALFPPPLPPKKKRGPGNEAKKILQVDIADGWFTIS